MIPNFGQLPLQLQTNLTHLFMQQRTFHMLVQHCQTALQTPTLNPQQRSAYVMQLAQMQNNLAAVSQQFNIQLTQIKRFQLQPPTQPQPQTSGAAQLAVPAATTTNSAAVAAAAAAAAANNNSNNSNGLGFFLKDGNSGTGGGGGGAAVAVSGATAPQPRPPEPQAQPKLQTELPIVKTESGAIAPAASVSAAAQQSNTTTTTNNGNSVSAVNFRMAPRAQQPTVVPVDKADEVLNREQKATLGRWLEDVARIERSNDFRVRETALYQERESRYRRILDDQRQHNAASFAVMRQERLAERHQLATRPAAMWGSGYTSDLGNGRPAHFHQQQHHHSLARTVVQIVVPGQRAVRAGRQPTLRFSRKQLRRQAAQREVLVPIRLEIDADGYRLRDAFTWDLNNELIEPRWFAQGLCLDLDLPPEVFVSAIAQSIEDQLEDYRQYGQTAEPSSDYLFGMLADAVELQQQEQELKPLVGDGVDEATAKMARVELQTENAEEDGHEIEVLDIRDTAEAEAEADVEVEAEAEASSVRDAGSLQADIFSASAWRDDELRIAIRIDIVIGHIALRDQLEWDVAPLLRPSLTRALGDELRDRARQIKSKSAARLVDDWVDGALRSQPASPERVARVLCAEKALGGEFETSIAHAIREQLHAFVKSFLLAGYAYRPQSAADYRAPIVDDRDLARCVLPPVARARRDVAATKTFAPVIVHLHGVDAERLEKDADRESRRKRRQGRGRGGAGAGGGIGGTGAIGAGGIGGVGAGGGGGPASAGLLLPPDREVHRTCRTMIALPSWFEDALPPDTVSFVSQPGEGAHFLDSYDIRATHEAAALALGGGSSADGGGGGGGGAVSGPSFSIPAPSHPLQQQSLHSQHHHHPPSLALGGASASAFTAAAASTAAASSQPSTPVTPALPATPQQLARERLRNPTGRPRGRPSILEKSLRDASALRSVRLEKLGHRRFRAGAVPGQLTGRPLEELCARWRCMCCGLAPDRTPLIRRGPESMHSLCDRCGDVYADSRRFRDIPVDEINRNVKHICGPLPRPTNDADLLDPARLLESLPPSPSAAEKSPGAGSAESDESDPAPALAEHSQPQDLFHSPVSGVEGGSSFS
ncbi:SWI/SNF chromatin-remodeling complex subunit [Coemansia sp. Benny D160-2]|nr:SWI/SNF chromatin-remodeling complex subunit [Coemansia sp. Benny D160-2]